MQVRLPEQASEVTATRGSGGLDALGKRRRFVTKGGAGKACTGAAATGQKPWDVIICDEAHVMRNISTLLGRRLRDVRARCRVLLTGTPVQNALQDLWSLMDFAQPGLLGNHSTFLKRFSDPIDKGSVSDAPPSAITLKRHLCDQLWQLV